ncbi:3-oxoacyl-[acyl-carrier-protein] reductase FabG1 [Halioglobus japonicus]|nr:3-oxoacyl-[acyl-carrier-protein] reductase FabG1 [Halioglobus japonicus]
MKKQRCVYITGGSSGIGHSLAKQYAYAGDNVVLIARDQAKLDAAVRDCKACANNALQGIAGVSIDVSDIDNLPTRVTAVIEEHGEPDILILCAGIAGNKTFLQMSSSEFDTLIAVNFTASREMARCILPAMLKKRRGKIVFMSSMSGLMGVYGYSGYCASKYAITGFAQALQQELYDTGVNAIIVCPTEVATPMIAAETDTVLPQTRLLKDLAGTLPPDRAAGIIIKGIDKNRDIVLTGFVPRLFDFSHRVFPGLFRTITRLIIGYASRKPQDIKRV